MNEIPLAEIIKDRERYRTPRSGVNIIGRNKSGNCMYNLAEGATITPYRK